MKRQSYERLLLFVDVRKRKCRLQKQAQSFRRTELLRKTLREMNEVAQSAALAKKRVCFHAFACYAEQRRLFAQMKQSAS